MTYHNVKNLTTWVDKATLKRWNKQRLLESSNPKKPIGWSEWIQTKVTVALNIQLPLDNKVIKAPDKANSTQILLKTKIKNPIDDYLIELQLLRRSSSYIKGSGYVLDKFQKSCKETDILDVDENTIKNFIQDMKKQQLTDRTLIDYVRAIERFYSFVIKSQKYGLTINPVNNIYKTFNRKIERNPTPVKSVEDIAKLIKGVHNPRDRAIIVLLAKTAIRNGELVALNLEDIDFDNKILNVNKHVGNHENNEIVKGRMNGIKSLIPLDGETIQILKWYLVSRSETKNKALFISHSGKRLYATDIIRIVKEWSINTGISLNATDTDKKIVPHFFRAWVTYMLQVNGCNPAVIDSIRGDITTRVLYTGQVLPFEVIKNEYLKAVPKFGIQ